MCYKTLSLARPNQVSCRGSVSLNFRVVSPQSLKPWRTDQDQNLHKLPSSQGLLCFFFATRLTPFGEAHRTYLCYCGQRCYHLETKDRTDLVLLFYAMLFPHFFMTYSKYRDIPSEASRVKCLAQLQLARRGNRSGNFLITSPTLSLLSHLT